MEQDDYRAIWKKLFAESVELEERRTNLENELNEVRARISNLENARNYIRPLAGMTMGVDLSSLGMTDAIRAILAKSNQRMSATDVRKALTSGGYNLSEYSSPMSSIYTILGRIAPKDGSGDVIREEDEKGNVFYRWKEDDLVQATEITDDDIPF